MQYRWFALLVALTPLFGASCGQKPVKSKKPIVVVSVVPQAYFVERIAGDLVDVKVMIPPGASPATYEPTMEQLMSLSEASLYVKVGHPNFPFERAWLAKLLDQGDGLRVVNGAAGIELLEGDPHTWLSPRCARAMTESIVKTLIEIIPSAEKQLKQNLLKLVKDIDILDADLHTRFSRLSAKRFFVFHPAWGYLAKEYGLEQVALEHGHKEPGPHDIEEVVEAIRADGVKTILVQPQMSAKSAEIVAREVGGRVVVVDPLPRDWLRGMRLFAEALQEALAP